MNEPYEINALQTQFEIYKISLQKDLYSKNNASKDQELMVFLETRGKMNETNPRKILRIP